MGIGKPIVSCQEILIPEIPKLAILRQKHIDTLSDNKHFKK